MVVMTTFHEMDAEETLQAAVARRLRGVLAEIRMTKTEFAARLGWDRGYLYRRLNGETPLDVADMGHIEQVTRIRAGYLVTGRGFRVTPPPGGGAPAAPLPEAESLLSGLNRRPFAYKRKRQPVKMAHGFHMIPAAA
jgi:transcriptional regulator with XRE-family HTH domain